MTLLVSLLSYSSLYAQSVTTKAGLWIVANKTTINGKKIPGILDVTGISESDKQKIRNAMKNAGLPTDSNPAFYCQQSDTIDINDVLKKVQTDCPNPSVKVSGSKISYNGKCHTDKGDADVSGIITILSKTESRSQMDASINVQGQQLKMHQQDVSKWIGANCDVPPAGIDPMWLKTRMTQN